MKILVTGGTGKVGREVVQALLRRGESVRVLTRNKEAKLPDGAEVAVGDLLDPGSVRSALNGVEKLFLLVGNATDELTAQVMTIQSATVSRRCSSIQICLPISAMISARSRVPSNRFEPRFGVWFDHSPL